MAKMKNQEIKKALKTLERELKFIRSYERWNEFKLSFLTGQKEAYLKVIDFYNWSDKKQQDFLKWLDKETKII